jgi:hypothetical protein
MVVAFLGPAWGLGAETVANLGRPLGEERVGQRVASRAKTSCGRQA